MIGMARATPNSKPYFILPRERAKVKQ